MINLKIMAMFGLSSLASCQKPHTNNIEPYYGHDYTYRKGDPCPHGTENKKNGESIRTNRTDRGWYGRPNQSTGEDAVGYGVVSSPGLYRRGYRTFVVERSGYTLHQEQGGK